MTSKYPRIFPPHCPQCERVMVLTRIEHRANDVDTCIFRCPKCALMRYEQRPVEQPA